MLKSSGDNGSKRQSHVLHVSHFLAPPALLLTPLIIFLRHHGYSQTAPEALFCLGLFATIGLLLGLPGCIGGRHPAVLVLAALSTLLIDIQLRAFHSWSFALLGTLLLATLAYGVLRDHLTTLVPVVAWSLLLSSLVLPTSIRLQDWSTPAKDDGQQAAPGDPERASLVLHIILDEQIGIEGIPSRFDPDGRIAGALRAFYLERGFELFGRAYSRYYDSDESISSLLDFSASLEPWTHYEGGFEAGKAMRSNRYFDEMSQRGYRIHVYQSDYMDFCNLDESGNSKGGRTGTDSGHTPIVASCHEYALETISSIEQSSLSVDQKARVILSMFARLSFLVTEFQSGYLKARSMLAGLDLTLPNWPVEMGRVSAVSAMQVFPRLQRDLAEAEPSSLYFAHLLLPHYPYAYDGECRLKPDMKSWLNGWGRTASGRRNDPRSREQRYPRYLEQMICTHRLLGALFDDMREHGRFEDALIIVHGDHGSRIDMGPPRSQIADELSRRDYIDAFSTLYAIKWPAGSAAYDRRILPIEELLARHVREGSLPAGADWARHPEVHLSHRGMPEEPRRHMSHDRPRMSKHWLPRFAHGETRQPE